MGVENDGVEKIFDGGVAVVDFGASGEQIDKSEKIESAGAVEVTAGFEIEETEVIVNGGVV